MVNEQTENCPKCNARWRGEDIYEHFLARRDNGDVFYANKTDEEILETASSYGYTLESPQYFSHLIGIEIRGYYDGVAGWKCPACGQVWNRFTGEEVGEERRLLTPVISITNKNN